MNELIDLGNICHRIDVFVGYYYDVAWRFFSYQRILRCIL